MKRGPSGRVTVPTELAALAAGVTVATIRKWASRGKLTRYGSPGRAEYDLDEVYELMARDSPKRHPRSHGASSRRDCGTRSCDGRCPPPRH